MTQRFEGRNLEEALTAAGEALGVERHRITHRVLVEKRGFLGGIKRVVIEAEVNEAAVAPVAPPVPEPLPAIPSTGRSESRDRGHSRGRGESRGRGDSRGGRGRRGESNGRHDDRGRGRGRRRDSGGDSIDVPREEIPPQQEESPAAQSVRDWCEEVLDIAGFRVEIRTSEDDERIFVRIHGADRRWFLERNGELLDAVQVLANKALVGRSVEKDIELDCADFKQQRVSDLEQRAREAADRVRRDGVEQLLPAMSPIERRIVHVALQDDADVTTESRGEGFYKRVAIVRRPASPVAEP